MTLRSTTAAALRARHFLGSVIVSMGLFQATVVPVLAQTEGPPPNPLGWEWVLGPFSYDPSWELTGAHGLILERQVDDDGLVLRIIHPIDEERLEYRPVAISGEGKRHDFKMKGGVRAEGFALFIFRLPISTLSERDIERMGIEVLTAEGKREIAEGARAEAQHLGMELLLPPSPGERFEFSLTTIDGEKVSEESLAGKVVLVDVWATWCAPCMAKMPRLVEFYESLHPEGFEVVGVNMDQTQERFHAAREELALPWRQVFVPAEPEKRQLWEEATGIEALPRQFLIDREGILRHDSSSLQELEGQVRKLLREGA